VADESSRLREDEGIGGYKRRKIAAERLVEALVAERGLAAIIVSIVPRLQFPQYEAAE
jgi:dihydroflavonol-4-reductase